MPSADKQHMHHAVSNIDIRELSRIRFNVALQAVQAQRVVCVDVGGHYETSKLR
jgi:hypothetical protein